MKAKRTISLKTKFGVFFFDYNHLILVFMFFMGYVIINRYDPFELRSDYYLSKDKARVQGVLSKKWEAETTSEHDVIKLGYDFSFVLPDRGTFKGTSYSKFNKFNEGDSVLIEYVPDAPSYSRIIRFDVIAHSKLALRISLTLFTVGFLWFLASIVKFSRRLSLLKSGELKKVKFVDYKPIKSIFYKSRGFERGNTYFRTYHYRGAKKKERYSHVSLSRGLRLIEEE